MLEALVEFLSPHESFGEGAKESQQAPDSVPIDNANNMPTKEKAQPPVFIDPRT